MVPFLNAGLQNGEYCLWVPTDMVSIEESVRVLSNYIHDFGIYQNTGQMEIISPDEWYRPNGSFHVPHVLKQVRDKTSAAHAKKFKGVRGAGGIHKISRSGWKSILDYESQIHHLTARLDITILCTYSLPNCPLKHIPKIIENHHKTFLKKGWNWEVVAGKGV